LTKYQKIYVLGAGAVGCFFGGMLARAGLDVTLIARPERARAINESGLELDCKTFHEVVHIKASSDIALLAGADLILLSVKSPDTESVIRSISTILPSHSVILSLQNGVANVPMAKNLIPNAVYPAVVYVAAGMNGPRTMKHHGRGELLLGSIDAMTDRDSKILTVIGQLFDGAGIPCAITQDIKKQMWLKFLVNCSYNAISAIGHISYGEMVSVQAVRDLIDQITKEFLMIASMEGVNISQHEAKEANELIAVTMATQFSSTAQDLARGKKTEIEFLNGYIVELAKLHGIDAPANLSVYAMVKMLEGRVL